MSEIEQSPVSPSQRGRGSNLTRRVLTALVATPVALGATWLGGWTFAMLIAAVALIAQREVYRLFEEAGLQPFVWLGLGLGLIAVLRPLSIYTDAFLYLGFFAVVLMLIARRTSKTPLADAAATAFGVVYPAWLAGALVGFREWNAPWLSDNVAFWITAAIIFGTLAADTIAYFAGRAWGRRAFFARISPRKTVEGFLGGVAGALVAMVLFKVMVLADTLTWLDVVILSFICGVLGAFGDLVESLFKRDVGAKDSGNVLPGHGGILDRIDSLLVSVPLSVAYFVLTRGI